MDHFDRKAETNELEAKLVTCKQALSAVLADKVPQGLTLAQAVSVGSRVAMAIRVLDDQSTVQSFTIAIEK